MYKTTTIYSGLKEGEGEFDFFYFVLIAFPIKILYNYATSNFGLFDIITLVGTKCEIPQCETFSILQCYAP